MEKEDQSTGRTRFSPVVITKQADAVPSINDNLPGLRMQLFFSQRADLQAGQNGLKVRISQAHRRIERGQASNFVIFEEMYYFQTSFPLFGRRWAHLGISLFQ